MIRRSSRTQQGVRVSRAVPRGFSPKALRELRVKRGVSVADLARVSGIGTATIAGWERGASTPQIDLLAKAVLHLSEGPSALRETMEAVILVDRADRDLADWRAIAGLLQPVLAQQLGISTMAVSNLERGVTPLRPQIAEQLSVVLDISLSEVDAAWQTARRRPL